MSRAVDPAFSSPGAAFPLGVRYLPDVRETRPVRRTRALVLATALAVAMLAGCGSASPPTGDGTGGTDSAGSTVSSTAGTASTGGTPSATAPATGSATGSPSPSATGPTGAPVNGPNSITSPTPGSKVAGPTVTVQGAGTAFEGTLSYRVVLAKTQTVVTQGFTDAGANGVIGPFSFEVGLPSGAYSVQVWEADMSNGADGVDQYRNLVQVDFTVK